MGSQTFISEATEFFSTIDSRSMFVVLHGYTNNNGEQANHSVLWHVNYKRVIERSREILDKYIPVIADSVGRPFTVADLEQAKQELMDSFAATLNGTNRSTSAHAYDSVLDSRGESIPGIKLHRDNDEIHLTSLYRINKVVLVPGVYPEVKSRPLTLAKNYLRSKTPVIRWGQYVLGKDRFERFVAKRHTIVEQDCLREFS